MQNYPLTDDFFQGHISLERKNDWVKPWRLPHSTRTLFPSPEEGLLARAEMASGVRLRFATQARKIRLHFDPLPETPPACGRDVFHFDLTVGGELVAEAPAAPRAEEALFEDLPSGEKVVDIWLLQEV